MNLKPIAIVESCFKEKFGIPRQPGLAPSACANIRMLEPYNQPEAFWGLEQSSHIWLQFIFHASLNQAWKPRVKMPRLGGNKTVGVFASRSPNRPNALGLSVVKLDAIDDSNGLVLKVSGIDLLDQTPVLDIKPYLPYADSVVDASNALAPKAPESVPVLFSDKAKLFLDEKVDPQRAQRLQCLLQEILAQDPRPSYKSANDNKVYGVSIDKVNVNWRCILRNRQLAIEVLDMVCL